MEEHPVVIVGAGPSGLALGLALSRFQVPSIILEKTKGVTADPRGVYLTADAIRILHDLGIQDIHKIGHEVHSINFHRSSLSSKPFYTLNFGSNIYNLVAAGGLLQSQPKLELALRELVRSSQWCELREGCCVVGRSEDDPPIIEYVADDNTHRHIKCQWLVGADGKTGIVRKHFLEPTAGIVQEDGKYRYSGTWIATNLKITHPTPETHPEFPLWQYGYSSDEVYDLFWPRSWHFCSPPGKPTATGRFGPHSDRTWRHEFRQNDWNDSMDAEVLFWEHITPMITRTVGKQGEQFAGPVEFPRDCVEVLRCRPFTFVHKVVNRWFDKRTILIGDAAHVFPPFAGQGIASGVRDAHQLAWRLALLVLTRNQQPLVAHNLLQSWAVERRKSVDDAAMFSIMNGHMCNNEPSLLTLGALWVRKSIEAVPFLPKPADPQTITEAQGYIGLGEGFLSEEFKGGTRLPQIYLRSASSPNVIQSDEVLRWPNTIFSLLITTTEQEHTYMVVAARKIIQEASMHPSILAAESIVVMWNKSQPPSSRLLGSGDVPIVCPTADPALCASLPQGYEPNAYMDLIGWSTKFSILRSDFFCFSCVQNTEDLAKSLAQLKQRCGGESLAE